MTATLDLGAAGVHEVAFYHLHQKHVDFVFVDHPVYHRAGMSLAVQMLWKDALWLLRRRASLTGFHAPLNPLSSGVHITTMYTQNAHKTHNRLSLTGQHSRITEVHVELLVQCNAEFVGTHGIKHKLELVTSRTHCCSFLLHLLCCACLSFNICMLYSHH